MKTPWWSLWSAHNDEFKPRLTHPLVRENHCPFEMRTMKILYMPVCSWTRGHISRNTVLKCSPWRAAARLLLPDECEDKSIAPMSGSLVAESSSIIRWSRGDRCVETHMHTHSHWQWPPRDHHLHAKASNISPRCPAPRETHPSASLHVSHLLSPLSPSSGHFLLVFPVSLFLLLWLSSLIWRQCVLTRQWAPLFYWKCI